MNDPGCYQLLIHLEKERRIGIGKLGRFYFPAGWYIYTGSALGGMTQRISRHLRKEKRLHWHIDYLLQYAQVKGVKKCLTTRRKECSLSVQLFKRYKAEIIVKKFGSSDCRCDTHLAYFEEKPDIPNFKRSFECRN
ncbi:GIY-YIG nuclease family protein [Candidatus Sumerlaeota bacterium]|nr:GIY-YIG nuclease family protein [Candidatus Sumerlaeota bacterium]